MNNSTTPSSLPDRMSTLTFCIPTYNRGESVHRLVTSILSCPDPDIDVVVLDNGSTGNTLEVLHAIDDPRLNVLSNGENKGALFNMVNVLDKGQGRFVVYSTDQDHLDPALIPEFKAFLLSTPELACGHCDFDGSASVPHRYFEKGFESVRALGYRGRHPTGYFFDNAMLKSIDIVGSFSDFEFVDLFPLEFAFAELSLMGRGAVFARRLFSPETGASVVTHKSSTTQGSSSRAFFAPAARLKLALSFTRHLDALDLPQPQKARLAAQIFVAELRAATLGYKYVLGNEKLCIHYRMDRRVISTRELFGIGFTFCRGYFDSRYASNVAGRIAFATSVSRTLFGKMLGRVTGRGT